MPTEEQTELVEHEFQPQQELFSKDDQALN